MLSSSQQDVFNSIMKGKSGFLTSSGGTGKTFLINHIAKHKKCHITSTTGSSAILINGVTVHSLFKLFPDDSKLDKNLWKQKCLNRVESYFKDQLRAIKCLIIDEISMLSPVALDMIDAMLRKAKSNLPFGGIQIILCGDLCQLPPIEQGFIFDSVAFWTGCDELWELTECQRQKDPTFFSLLQRARFAELTEEDFLRLEKRIQPITNTAIIPTKLFSKNKNVDFINQTELNNLTTEEITCSFSGGVVSKGTERQIEVLKKLQDSILKDLHLDKDIHLKIGAQVMLTYNLDVKNGLANGSRGVVVGYKEGEEMFSTPEPDAINVCYPGNLPIVEFTNGKKITIPYVAIIKQLDYGYTFVWTLPIRLAWATSIHRSQGQSLSCVHISLNEIFESGMGYVAISRVTDENGLTFENFNRNSFRIHPRVKEFYKGNFNLQKIDFLKQYKL